MIAFLEPVGPGPSDESSELWSFYHPTSLAELHFELFNREAPEGITLRWSFALSDAAGEPLPAPPGDSPIAVAHQVRLPERWKREQHQLPSGAALHIEALTGSVCGIREPLARFFRRVLRQTAERTATVLGLSGEQPEGTP
jgi:hypothetical protein